MLRLKGSDYTGQTLTELLKVLIADPARNRFSEKPYLVILNGKLIKPSNYETIEICESDIVTIMPFIAGG